MAFFDQMRTFFELFILFGFWTSWSNSRYKKHLLLYSLVSIVQIVLNFSLAIIFDRFYEFSSLSNVVADIWAIFSILTQITIVLESVLQSQTQLEITQNLGAVDRIFTTKLRMRIAYRHEKRQLFTLFSIMIASEFVAKTFPLIHYSAQGKPMYELFYVALCPEMMIVLRLAQVFFFVSMIDSRLCLINKILRNEVLFTAHKNMIKNRKKLKNVRKECSLDAMILNMKRVYGILHDVCEQIDRIFRWSLLMIIVYIFMNFTLHFYWVFMNISLSKNEESTLNLSLLMRFGIVSSIVAMRCSSCGQQVCDFKLIACYIWYEKIVQISIGSLG